MSIIALDIILHSLDERLNVVFKCVLGTVTQKRILFLPEYSFQEQLLCIFLFLFQMLDTNHDKFYLNKTHLKNPGMYGSILEINVLYYVK